MILADTVPCSSRSGAGSGRCAIAQRELSPGEVVWRSPPLAVILHEQYRGQRCDYCFCTGTEGDFRVDQEALETLQTAEDQPHDPLPAVSLSIRIYTDETSAAAVRLAAVLPHGYPASSGADIVPIVWLEPEVNEGGPIL
eukprot:symbB.v1.2.006187.t1/scaffold367.1/size382069/20